MNPWIAVNLPYGADWWEVTDEGQCFVLTHGELKAGMLIDTDRGIELVGHVNEAGGLCDCCAALRSDTMIKRFRIVWNEDESS